MTDKVIYAIFFEDGSMDEGPVVLTDEIYTTRLVADIRRNELYAEDLAQRKIDYNSDPWLSQSLENEIGKGFFGNLNPLYEVRAITLKEKPTVIPTDGTI